MVHKGPVLRPRCIGTGRVRTQIPFTLFMVTLVTKVVIKLRRPSCKATYLFDFNELEFSRHDSNSSTQHAISLKYFQRKPSRSILTDRRTWQSWLSLCGTLQVGLEIDFSYFPKTFFSATCSDYAELLSYVYRISGRNGALRIIRVRITRLKIFLPFLCHPRECWRKGNSSP